MSAEDAAKWKGLAEQARAGDLYLDDEAVARECLKACTDRIADLDEMLIQVRRTKVVSGFGDFVMAGDLTKKFAEQGADIETSLLEHIETVKNMQEVMRLSISKLVGQDVDNAGNIKATP
ncbi:hypothetical protein [Nocardia mexicana]|uniref:Uncharacterized protein n=1 Tax=Nocardia mexicana TaxID=279262 RepID=A0A370HCK4_9NOCA|nr:hypothetical protein [Nocardia mexicana]RDI54672.1 hypothetical protein DFR68_102802 [Nocardia mexicana]